MLSEASSPHKASATQIPTDALDLLAVPRPRALAAAVASRMGRFFGAKLKRARRPYYSALRTAPTARSLDTAATPAQQCFGIDLGSAQMGLRDGD